MKERTYPSYMFYNGVPNEYETIEFINHLKSIIEESNGM